MPDEYCLILDCSTYEGQRGTLLHHAFVLESRILSQIVELLQAGGQEG